MSANTNPAAPPSPCRVGALETASDVKVEAGRLYRAARRGELPASDASKLASVLTLVLKVIQGSEWETRLAALEARAPAP